MAVDEQLQEAAKTGEVPAKLIEDLSGQVGQLATALGGEVTITRRTFPSWIRLFTLPTTWSPFVMMSTAQPTPQ